jgi:hypothetical protein
MSLVTPYKAMLYYNGDDITKCVILADVRMTRKDVIGKRSKESRE